jgi:hypothetical protein
MPRAKKKTTEPKETPSKLKKRAVKPRSRDDAHYVNNKQFLEAFIVYNEKYNKAKEENRPLPKLPNYIGECFMKIAEKFSHHANFVNYPYRDEMISDAIENCVMYAHDFDPKKGTNPFAYFTQVTWNAFIRRINKENKNKYITYKSHQNQLINNFGLAEGLTGASAGNNGQNSSNSSEESFHRSQNELYDNINNFIEDYERRAKEKRIEKKKRLAASKVLKTRK